MTVEPLFALGFLFGVICGIILALLSIVAVVRKSLGT